LPADAVDPLGEGFSDVNGPPVNVIWNVELHPSIRARYRGSIEFSEPSYFKLPPDDSYCNRPKINKNECRRRWMLGTQLSEQQASHPLRFRYEFDVTDHGIEFVQAFKKTRQVEDEPWVDGGIDSDGCAYRAIKANPAKSNENQEDHSPGIPKELLDSAKQGQTDAQYLVGTMYAEGIGVPQDYAEAYFWLNIAASATTASTPRDLMTKARDAAASRLTPAILLQTQERTRKWVEENPAASSTR
jgi:hypothetical protein